MADAVSSLDGLSFLVSLIAGVGCLTYVAVSWIMHFWASNNYVGCGIVAFLATAVAVGSLKKMPIALLILFGSAIVVVTAFSTGVSDAVMP